MSRTQLALAGLVLFALGGLLGAAVVHQPTPVPVTTAAHVEQAAKLDEVAAHEARTEDTASVFRVLPGVKVTTKKTTYRPPAALPPFPGSPQVCNCPAPAIASVEETTSETGPGSESINTADKAHTVDLAASAAQSSSWANVTATPAPVVPESRLSLALGVSTQLTDKTRLGLAASAGVRVYKDWGVRASVDKPFGEPARAAALLEARFR